MKKITISLCLNLVTLICLGQTQSCITQSEAEKILGQKANLTMSRTETKDNIKQYRCTYTSTYKSANGNRESNLYYLLEDYDKAGTAASSFAYILSQNAGMPGLNSLPGFGDEAIIQTDSENFEMIIVRKSDKIIRLKVNKLTPVTSVRELKAITKKMTELL